ncbi:Cof-type HAD-IIB family hydrolase [Clostridium perfringens]|uniref:Cof-type HAD-IIB family hydrolase n=1 Tax=Clostridium perfringens TaxID=1502 RepID=UPI0028FEDD5B|nr:Cof-type HAD-IIB family hydrolase [Clostridium perfringens]MDU3018308.1 Cof-type HAD-IIB family hydrolase [Clostridium perfringens]
MNYKLVCIDMDGTLLDSHHRVSERNKEALKKAIEKGVHIAISTGRVFPSARIYGNIIGVNAPLICSNGSYIKDKNTDEVIFKSTLDRETYFKICDIINKYKFLAYVDSTDGLIADTDIPEDDSHRLMNSWVDEEEKIKFYKYDDLRDAYDEHGEDILKFIIIKKEEGPNIEEAKDEFEGLEGVDLVYASWGGCIEIMKKGTSKGSAVKALADKLRISLEEVICIGDSGNDVSMLEEAGLSVVMGNAPDFIKEYGDYITDTNENDGVAKAIEKFILK